MGDTLPPDWPELNPIKFYKVTCAIFSPGPAADLCVNQTDEKQNCYLGIEVEGYLALGRECHQGDDCCGLDFGDTFKIINIEGPYDNFGACMA